MKFNKKDLSLQIEKVCYQTGSFQLRSGQISDFYFDKYQFETNPALLNAVIDHLIPMIPSCTQVLAGLELGGIPIATALSLKTQLPIIFVRKKAKEYGTKKVAEGICIQKKNILLVEDVITTGGAVCSSATHLKQEGGLVENVLCVIQRSQEKKNPESFTKEGLKLQSLFCLSDFTLLKK